MPICIVREGKGAFGMGGCASEGNVGWMGDWVTGWKNTPVMGTRAPAVLKLRLVW